MNPFISITSPKAGPDEPRRLNSFPGRYLSEREFELLQAYVDDRITPLVSGLPTGIVSGMELRPEGSGSNTVLNIQPGVAVGAGGRLIRLFYPLKQQWPEFVELIERNLLKQNPGSKLRDGLYFLTLHAVVEEIDKNVAAEPCSRTEPDPLRQRRLETVILPSLQLITANPRLMAMPQARAANRICVRFLKNSPHDPETGAIPVALIKVENRLPAWIDTVAGRYLSEPDAAYRTFLAHTIERLDQWLQKGGQSDATPALATLLGIDYLPSAGPLPLALLADPSGKEPRPLFHPADLQVELAPVPASTIGGVIDRELPRGSVDLVHGLGDRIRLLLAIPDLDYRPTLMDLPQRDSQLEEELFKRETAAAKAWKAWWLQWQQLFAGLSETQCKLKQVPQYKLGLMPQALSRPRNPDACRYQLVKQRLLTLYGNKIQFPDASPHDPGKLDIQEPGPYTGSQIEKKLGSAGMPVPEPYSSHLLSPYAVAGYTPVEPPEFSGDGLLLQHDQIRQNIQELEKDLDESYRLLNEMDDYLNLQRQQLDSITLSFSALAGGVAGDGAGSSMMRWNGAVAFAPTTPKG